MVMNSRYAGEHSDVLAFFVASDDQTAAAVVDAGPDETVDQVRCAVFDVIYAMLDWESTLTGRDVVELLEADEPRVVADSTGASPVVLAASAALHRGLATADQSTIVHVAERWIRMSAARDDVLDVVTATRILSELTGLARIGTARNDRLYCWLP